MPEFSGSIPALVTPFVDDEVHLPSLARLVHWHIEQGSSALVVCGTTGESPTLGHDEHGEIVACAVSAAAGRVPVIAGAGSNSTREAVALSRLCAEAGAQALLHVTGYYNRPSPAQVHAHFRAVGEATALPILVYDIPARTGLAMTVDELVALAALPHVAGVKDATGDMARLSQARAALPPGFAYLSGDDASSLGYLAHGGHGCISTTANVAPALCAQMHRAAAAGDFAQARRIHERLMPLHLALFREPNPAGVKYALSRLGLCEDSLRLPLTPAGARTRAAIDAAMAGLGLAM
jgi:4-hydroxy-tetrahydrodipicolinate synthase